MVSGAERQRAYMARRTEELERLRARVAELEGGAKVHAACDARIAELEHTISVLQDIARRRRVEIEDLKGYNDL